MALMIRLRKQGRTNRQTFRLVVTDGKTPRDGKYLEKLGWYLPCEKTNNIHVDEERVNFWLSKGACFTEKAEKFVGKAAPGVVKELHAKQLAKRIKECAKRRALRKKKGKAIVVSSAIKAPAAKATEKKAAPKAPAKKTVKKAPAKAKTAEKPAETPSAETQAET